jgi:hypothetical protein
VGKICFVAGPGDDDRTFPSGIRYRKKPQLTSKLKGDVDGPLHSTPAMNGLGTSDLGCVGEGRRAGQCSNPINLLPRLAGHYRSL